jgi:hypothetical protein
MPLALLRELGQFADAAVGAQALGEALPDRRQILEDDDVVVDLSREGDDGGLVTLPSS